MTAREYAAAAPHLRYPSIHRLFVNMLEDACRLVPPTEEPTRVLDLGAGNGAAALPFLERGYHVIAVDVSERMLETLSSRAGEHAERLTVCCSDVFDALNAFGRNGEMFDIAVFNSFLHHIPDYSALVAQAISVLNRRSVVLSFQDPLRYDTVPRATRLATLFFYYLWRLTKGDLIAGMERFFRRKQGRFDDSVADNVEYHVLRNGVDHNALREQLSKAGFDVDLRPYFSGETATAVAVGRLLRMKNQFGMLARRDS